MEPRFLVIAARDQALFGVVGNVGSDNWMNATDESIGTNHINVVHASFHERCENGPHAIVEKLMARSRPLLFREDVGFENGEIPDKHHGMC